MALANRAHDAVPGSHKREYIKPASTRRSLPWRPWRGSRRKRILLVILGIGLLYVFFKNIPTDVPPVSQRIDPRFGQLGLERTVQFQTAEGSSDPTAPSQNGPQHHFDGPVKFYQLAASFQSKSDPTSGRNSVLFAVSNLKSAPMLIPLACEMSQQRRNRVHVIFTGRDEAPLEAVKTISGVTGEDCTIYWHDGRPDHASISSDERMKISVEAALGHVTSFAQPRVVIFDDSEREDTFFRLAIRHKASQIDLGVLPIPAGCFDNLRWIARLDGTALRHWNQLQLDIVVHNSAESSASLIRLLKSLQNADYFGLSVPRLAIELPCDVDPPTTAYISSFRWPASASPADSKLTIRRRTSPRRFTLVQASLQTVESFYPANPATSHVLILSPNAELSPSFFQYLMFLLLEYKYSTSTIQLRNNLLGIALEEPNVGLDGETAFIKTPSPSSSSSLFLSQAPNSNAALYFGDKWTEFHEFLSHRFTINPETEGNNKGDALVSKKYPAFMEFLLEFARAEGYLMLYPGSLAREGSAIVTIHEELYQMPEEHFTDEKSGNKGAPQLNTNSVLTAGNDGNAAHSNEISFSRAESVLSLLFLDNQSHAGVDPILPALTQLPVFSYLGKPLLLSDTLAMKQSFADEFSVKHGGCEKLTDRRKSEIGHVGHLFCASTPERADGG